MNSGSERVLVTGGRWLHSAIISSVFSRHKVIGSRGVDLKLPEFCTTTADEFETLDLRRWEDCVQATRSVDTVYALAADMGGHGVHLQQSCPHFAQQFADQPAHAGSGPQQWRSSIPVHFLGPAFIRVPSTADRCRPVARGGSISCRASGCLWMGEADHRTALYSLPSRLTEWRRGSFASTTFLAHTGRLMAAGKRLPPP